MASILCLWTGTRSAPFRAEIPRCNPSLILSENLISVFQASYLFIGKVDIAKSQASPPSANV